MAEKRIAFESNAEVDAIGVPPNVVLDLNTQYGKVVKVEFSKDSFIAGRLEAIPFKFHSSNKLYINSGYKNQLSLKEVKNCICNVIEPDFVKEIVIEEIKQDTLNALSPMIHALSDKSIIYLNMLIRHKDNRVYKVTSLSNDEKVGIASEDLILTIHRDPDAPDDSDSKAEGNQKDKDKDKGKNTPPKGDFSLDDFSWDSTARSEGHIKLENYTVTFEHLHKLKGINDAIHRLKMEVVFPFIELLTDPSINQRVGASLLFGPPGCGKTEIAHAIAKDLQLPFFNVSIGDLASKYVHQFAKNLSQVFAKAASQKQGAIIFLDEMDAYAGHRKNMNSQHDKENVNALLQELDPKKLPPHVLVFGATNYVSSLDSAVIRSGRFDTKIAITPPDSIGRAFIMRQKINDLDVALGEDITEHFINEYTHNIQGFVGADIDTLIKNAYSLARQEARVTRQEITLKKEHIDAANKTILPLCAIELGIKQPSLSKKDLPGSETFIETIQREVTALIHPEKFRSDITYKPDRGFILYGPPGTGKTSIANAIASETNLLLKVIKGTEFASQHVGVAQSKIREVFEQAELFQPIMIFIDEIDSIAKTRSGGFSNNEGMLNALMSEIDSTEKDNKVLVVGATNLMEDIDPALLRPGRLGTHFHVARPDRKQTSLIVKHLLKDIPQKLSSDETEKIADHLYQQQKTQSDMADYFNKVKSHLFFHTKEGNQADFKLFEQFLTDEVSDED